VISKRLRIPEPLALVAAPGTVIPREVGRSAASRDRMVRDGEGRIVIW
jgi:hypothetical protein